MTTFYINSMNKIANTEIKQHTSREKIKEIKYVTGLPAKKLLSSTVIGNNLRHIVDF